MHGLLVRCAVLLAVCWLPIHPFSAIASTVLSLPNVDLRQAGTVRAMVQQPDGGVVIGGSFTFVDGHSRQNIARFLPDGSLDPDWNPGADGQVTVLAVDESGSIFADGEFRSIGGQSRRGLAKISGAGVGVVNPDWDPLFATSVWPLSPVSMLAVGPDNKLYVSGEFDTIGGQQITGLVRLALDGVGAADPQWRPVSAGITDTVAFDGSGHVFAALGQRLIKVSLADNGQIDPSWTPNVLGYSFKIVLGSDGNLYVSGLLDVPGMPSYPHDLIRVSSTGQGQVDYDWPSESLCCVNEIAGDSQGNLYVSALFPGDNPEFDLRRLLKLSMADGTLDPSWVPEIALQSPREAPTFMPDVDGNLWVGGRLFKGANELRMGYLVLGPDAKAAASMDVHASAFITSIARQPGGGTVVAGRFEKANDLLRNGILRLSANGELDSTWNPLSEAPEVVYGVSVDSAGHVYAYGGFGNIVDGIPGPGPGLVRIEGSGSGQIDMNWNPRPSYWVSAMLIGPDDDIYAVGRFPVTGSKHPFHLAKLRSTDGSVDPVWNPQPDGAVYALAMGNDGDLIVAGQFSTIAGGDRRGVAKLSRDGHGALDSVWAPGKVAGVTSLATDGLGRVYLGGSFTSVADAPIARLARVSGDDGALDTVWNPAPNSEVLSMYISADDSVFVGGYFSTIGGAERNLIAKLDPWSDVGAADLSWDAQSDGPVRAIADGGNASVIVGGYFEEISGQRRNSLAALRDGTDLIFFDGFE